MNSVVLFFDSKNRYLKQLIWIVLISTFVLDALHVFIDYYSFDLLYSISKVASFSAIPRFIAWVIGIMYFFIYYFTELSKWNKIFVGIVLSFLTINVFLQPTYDDQIGYMTYIVKLTLPLLMYLLLLRLGDVLIFAKVSLHYFFINSIVAVCAVVFNLDVFKVYFGSRFGYYGLMIAANQLSFIYITMLTMLVLMKNEFSRVYFYILFLFFSLAAVSLGTKALWGSLLVVYVVLYFDGRLNKLLVIISFIIGFSFLLFFVSKYSGFFYFKTLFDNHGLTYTVTSKRNELIFSVFYQFVLDFNLWHYLFGGVNLKRGFVEMDFLDIFLSVGVIGLGLFIYCISKLISSLIKKSILYLGFVFLFFAVGTFAGHSLTNALNFIFLPIVFVLFNIESKKLNL